MPESELLSDLVGKTADYDGLAQLYRYESYNRDYLVGLIKDSRLHFSEPQKFNDPWDCRLHYDYASLSDPKIFEEHIQWYIDVTRRITGLPQQKILGRANIFRKDSRFFISKLNELSIAMGEEIARRYRVYCLAAQPNCELMWAHYGNKHKGICLEFSTADSLFGNALRISYRAHYPSISLTSDEDLSIILIKSAVWSYEHEYRLVAQERSISFPHPTLVTDDNFLRFPTKSLTGVIAGCMATDETIHEIKSILKSNKHTATLKRIVRASDRYHLEVVAVP